MYIPHTQADREAMLARIGVDSVDELFSDVPEQFRDPHVNVPAGHTEMEAAAELEAISGRNISVQDMSSFLGAGSYHHYIPAVVDTVLRRGEFYTAYTPYQPEISQGTLQAIFEYQSLMINLMGMEVSNASHYDGATATAEAVNMAHLIHRGRREKVILSPGLHPQYRQTVRTYLIGSGREVVGEDISLEDGPNALIDLLDEEVGIVVVQYPDFFGRIYDHEKLAEAVHEAGALLAVAANPIAMGLLTPPGNFGADIVIGEGQPLGIPLSYGGPYLGILTTKEKYLRSMAGRLAGETTDVNGKRGYVLTLSTREQHIRRERASSNICTNQGLMALAATAYLSLVGKEGLREVAELCYHRAHYAAEAIGKLPGYSLWNEGPYFHEFVVEGPRLAKETNALLLEKGIIGGYDLGMDFPGMENYLLFAVTEMNSKEDIDRLAMALEEIGNA
ncbi:MAG: aminomethyl-transferring glycine dehydrogenase subunit GcvPA [Anaerolineae bacterium]|nr:aminomethyl-transferring glycine dehydrogenase subunit GcvPA [Anaerolineae bacterium]